MKELMPCPFCGGEASIEIAHPFFMKKKFQNKFVFAGCKKCHITTSLFYIKRTRSELMNNYFLEKAEQAAAEVWNRRIDNEH